ncbi:MAG TPA: SDR family NAD(P)-dependent oxidoreductase [Bryobacteraceae bacterium]|nr:SDR family NAD(P)-dependent oxidoreductase [Bryobacteraceae bacterium]
MLLSERVALVTGAATGIGEAIARLLAREGARVFLLDRDSAGVRAAADSIGDFAQAFAADVRKPSEIAAAVQAAMAQFGHIDILVNNAGIFPRQPFLEMTEAQWDEMQDVNLKSMFHTHRLVLPHMFAQRAGKVVNISSITFFLGIPGLSHYVASKGGVVALTRSLAREAGPHNVNINCIAPGAIQTASEKNFVSEEQARQYVAQQCFDRRITPLDVAKVCLFLSSPLSDAMTGQCLLVDGGWYMH